MVDTARHFLPLQTLKRQLRALALAKLNVLHIHLIDMQSNAFGTLTDPAANFQRAAYNTGGSYLL